MEKTAAPMRVGDVARLAGITVRSLHHYDEIGLVSPRRRTASGYRLYERSDVERLQEVLFFRELGFSLDEIKGVVDEPDYQRRRALGAHRRMLIGRIERLRAMVAVIDRTLDTEKGDTMRERDMLEVFGDFDPGDHAAEVEERWGDTDAYRHSTQRTANHTKADWKRIKEEAGEIDRAFAGLRNDGIPADSDAAMEVAERHRRHIQDWFYDCGYEMHAGLGEMYVTDPRFTAKFDATAPGLAAYVGDAIAANADRH